MVSHSWEVKERDSKEETRKQEEIGYWQKEIKETASERVNRWWRGTWKWMVPDGTRKGKTERKGDILRTLKKAEWRSKRYKQKDERDQKEKEMR